MGVEEGRRLYRREHRSRFPEEQQRLPDVTSAFGRGRLLALSVNSSTAPEVRKAARQALTDWHAEHRQGDA